MPVVDYLLLTPLDEEWRTVRSTLCSDPAKVRFRPIDAITYYLWTQAVNRPPWAVGEYLVVAASMGRKTPGETHAGVFSTHCVNQWMPGHVVLLGVAGSLEPESLQLGDVIVSPEIYGYEVADVVASDIRFRTTFNQIGALDLDRVRALRDDPVDYPNWQQECLNAANAAGLLGLTRPPQLHLEVTASGNYVVKSVEFGQKLRKEVNRNIKAVEMEARGLHQALYLNANRTDALMIRGVSDYADENKGDLEETTKGAWRTFAAGNAARLIRAIWRRGPVAPISPAYVLDLTVGPHSRFRQKDVPSIEYKHVGSQHIAFPTLLKRAQPTPELFLEMTARCDSGVAPSELRGQCIVESPGRKTVEGSRLAEGKLGFTLPPSEWGIHAELLLSFPTPVDEIRIVCRDDFQRLSEAVINSPKV